MQSTKILLVDDEKPYVDTMIKRLSKRGLAMLAAYDGGQALEQLDRDGTIDVVILDIKMPRMDGIAALRQIKGRHPLVEVILLTGHATVETGIEGMKMGAFDYLMKPCDTDELVSKIDEAADRKRIQEEKIMAARIQTITLRTP
jgi:DNA-binding NtrC family response regulator